MSIQSLNIKKDFTIENGGHILYFSTNKLLYIDNLVAYVIDGIMQGNTIIIIDEPTIYEAVKVELLKAYSIEDLQYVFFEECDRYYGIQRDFDSEVVSRNFGHILQSFPKNDRTIQIWAKVVWRKQEGIISKLEKFEQNGDRGTKASRMISVCAYDSMKTPANLLMKLLKNHDYFMTDTDLIVSPLYEKSGTIFPSLSTQSKMDSEIDYLNKDLENKTRRFKQLFNSISDAVYYFKFSKDGLSGKFIEVNEVAYSRLGYTYEEMLNLTPFDIDVHEKKEFLKLLDTIYHNETTIFETIHICKDGSLIPVEIKTDMLVENGDCYILTVCRDISERKKSEEFYINSEKLSIIGKLAASIAHEIRNPLTTIKGFMKLQQEGMISDLDIYSIIDSEIDRIETIASELLILGKPVSQKLVAADVGKYLKDVCIVMQSQANLDNVSINFEAAKQALYCHCNEQQLKQVFMNIIKNAIESLDNHGYVTVSTDRTDKSVYIKIADNGEGIPDEVKEKLGQPFYTTKEKGTGLGLMACYKIIEQHNGKIDFTSEVGKGTVFSIELPLIKERKQGDGSPVS
ncbi:ATP-binding protein [Bacillus suaedae]|uniref:histidine kinase n=1 Tax=Halalkalibacter suaedae TaxID=2822140 RepID=A0A940WWI8_9BACI|nr:ATP-binding protein [Bacillus suaedae]MBP3953641.1 MEDS domain-containing protein [Bacillus suaedae]